MAVIDSVLHWIQSIASDNSHGYDQTNRWGPDYDCSSLVISAFKHAGVPLQCTYTGNMYSDMLAHGFEDVSATVNMATGTGLLPGDVLLNKANHTALYAGLGLIVHASSNEMGKVTGGATGDQTGGEICVRSYWNYPWDAVLRYTESRGSTPSNGGLIPPAEAQVPSSYTVKAGDVLSVIAMRFGLTLDRICEINNIEHPNFIYPGQVLKLVDSRTDNDSSDGRADSVGSVADKRDEISHIPTCRMGDNSMTVRAVQTLLRSRGYVLDVDGDFGSQTLAAVKSFQNAARLTVTGEVNLATMVALLT